MWRILVLLLGVENLLDKAGVGESYAVIDTLNPNIVQYIDTDVQNGITYSYGIWPEGGREPCWQQYPISEAVGLDRSRLYPGEGFARIPEAWLTINTYITRRLEKLPKLRRTVVYYNRFVETPTEEMGRVYRFLNLDPSLAPLPDKMLNRNSKLVNSQTKDPLQEWRDTLSEMELEQIQEQLVSREEDLQTIERWIEEEGVGTQPVRFLAEAGVVT